MFEKAIKFYFISGEVSGDFLAAKVIGNLKNLNKKASFEGIGGALTEAEGIKSLFPIDEIAFMGFAEILPHIFKIKRLIDLTVKDILEKKPDILVTVDSPGFTYRVAALVRKQKPELKIVHIVAPSVWAYKPGRALKYAKIYDFMLALLPFEPPYFKKVGLKCEYIGHPIFEREFPAKEKNTRKKKIICVTPGSRTGEIKKHLPIFRRALDALSTIHDIDIIFVLPDQEKEEIVKPFLIEAKFTFKFSTDKLSSFAAADLALAKSGTNILEIAACGTPMIIAYKLNWLSYLIIKNMMKIKYVSLINILAQKEIIPEFLQSNCNEKNLSKALHQFLLDPKIGSKQVEESQEILQKLCPKPSNPPSLKAAKILANL